MQDIANYIKKEYKKATGNALTLTKEDKEPDILVQSDVSYPFLGSSKSEI